MKNYELSLCKTKHHQAEKTNQNSKTKKFIQRLHSEQIFRSWYNNMEEDSMWEADEAGTKAAQMNNVLDR